MKNASLLRRFGAMIYDGLLVFATLALGTVPFIAMRAGEAVDPGSLIYQITMFALTYAFFVGFWYHYGRTLGMQSWGVQIENAEGQSPSIAQCTIRYFGALLSWLLLGAGYLWQLVDKDGLSLHDRLSGTRLRHYPKPTKKPT